MLIAGEALGRTTGVMSEITQILTGENERDDRGTKLLPMVYEELRRLAAHRLAGERPGQTLQATALVHEAWLRLAREKGRTWKDSQHFFCAAATAMRRILIDNARRKQSAKHGGDWRRTTLEDFAAADQLPSEQLIVLDEALKGLAAEDAEAARLVELRFFAGLGHQEAAEVMGIGRREADGLWAYARAWLFEAINKELGATGDRLSP